MSERKPKRTRKKAYLYADSSIGFIKRNIVGLIVLAILAFAIIKFIYPVYQGVKHATGVIDSMRNFFPNMFNGIINGITGIGSGIGGFVYNLFHWN